MKDVQLVIQVEFLLLKIVRVVLLGYTFDSSTFNCLKDNELKGNYYENGGYKDYYETCKKCSTEGTSASHNCEECKKDYHLNRTTKNCINTQPI